MQLFIVHNFKYVFCYCVIIAKMQWLPEKHKKIGLSKEREQTKHQAIGRTDENIHSKLILFIKQK